MPGPAACPKGTAGKAVLDGSPHSPPSGWPEFVFVCVAVKRLAYLRHAETLGSLNTKTMCSTKLSSGGLSWKSQM